MRLPIAPSSQRAGYAMLMTMAFILVCLIVFASVMYWAASNSKVTLANNSYNQAEAAAESDTENILAYMIRDFYYGSVNTAPNYYSTNFPPTAGWPVQFQFTDTNGNTAYAATVSVGMVPSTNVALGAQFAGLYGFAQPTSITAVATTKNLGQNASATVSQMIQFALVPLFQFAIFYNMNLEINPGATMLVNGHVHSNGNLYATGDSSSSPLTFGTYVDASGLITNMPSPLDPHNVGRVGNVVYDLTVNNPLEYYDSLNMPIGATPTNNNPTNVLAILDPPPSTYAPPNYTAAYSTNGMVYLENAVDLIISNAANGLAGTLGTNIVVFYQNPNNSPSYIEQVQGNVPVATNVSGSGSSQTTNVVYAYSWVTNVSFYDYREGQTVQAVQVNVGALNTWLTNQTSRGGYQYQQMNRSGATSKGHSINSIYAYNSVPMTTSQLPAVRMANAQQLPSGGLTVATPQPLYVLGNYNVTTNGVNFSEALSNVTYTVPAALLGDAITVLSSNWSDSYTSSTALTSRPTTSTTLNAATLEGIVPSNGVNYSGGVENFLRLLENWSSSQYLNYNGSIVVMFPSQFATNFWQAPGVYYNPPNRQWGFDVNFSTSGGLPPLTPEVKGVLRNTWAAW
ncbi:MAG: hypothetical protein ABSE16_10765 [Verrucomicrobiota bacterium]|jgi:hypothetical protein